MPASPRRLSALLHYFRTAATTAADCEGDAVFGPAARERAHSRLLEYARLAEENFPHAALTYNMHILTCRLPRQEATRGYISKDGELWVERRIQRVKSNVEFRTTEFPEKLFAHDLTVDMALARMRHSDDQAGGSSAVQTFDELVPAYRANLRSGPYYDEGDALTYTQLLGKGKAAFGYERDGIVTQFLQYSTCMQQQEWLGDDQASLVQLHLDMFSLAFKRGDEILWS